MQLMAPLVRVVRVRAIDVYFERSLHQTAPKLRKAFNTQVLCFLRFARALPQGNQNLLEGSEKGEIDAQEFTVATEGGGGQRLAAASGSMVDGRPREGGWRSALIGHEGRLVATHGDWWWSWAVTSDGWRRRSAGVVEIG